MLADAQRALELEDEAGAASDESGPEDEVGPPERPARGRRPGTGRVEARAAPASDYASSDSEPEYAPRHIHGVRGFDFGDRHGRHRESPHVIYTSESEFDGQVMSPASSYVYRASYQQQSPHVIHTSESRFDGQVMRPASSYVYRANYQPQVPTYMPYQAHEFQIGRGNQAPPPAPPSPTAVEAQEPQQAPPPAPPSPTAVEAQEPQQAPTAAPPSPTAVEAQEPQQALSPRMVYTSESSFDGDWSPRVIYTSESEFDGQVMIPASPNAYQANYQPQVPTYMPYPAHEFQIGWGNQAPPAAPPSPTAVEAQGAHQRAPPPAPPSPTAVEAQEPQQALSPRMVYTSESSFDGDWSTGVIYTSESEFDGQVMIPASPNAYQANYQPQVPTYMPYQAHEF